MSLYTDFVLHNVSTDQIVVINAGRTPKEVVIPRGAYDIETIIAMLNESDAFLVRIGVLWRERILYHSGNLLLDRFHDCSWDPIDSRIRIKCASERTGQSAIILPEYLMQPNSSDQRHHVSRAINAYWILHVLQVHRGCWIVRWWMCFPLYRWPLRTSVWHSMFKEKGGTLNVIVTIRQSMDLVRLQGSNCLCPLSICT